VSEPDTRPVDLGGVVVSESNPGQCVLDRSQVGVVVAEDVRDGDPDARRLMRSTVPLVSQRTSAGSRRIRVPKVAEEDHLVDGRPIRVDLVEEVLEGPSAAL